MSGDFDGSGDWSMPDPGHIPGHEGHIPEVPGNHALPSSEFDSIFRDHPLHFNPLDPKHDPFHNSHISPNPLDDLLGSVEHGAHDSHLSGYHFSPNNFYVDPDALSDNSRDIGRNGEPRAPKERVHPVDRKAPPKPVANAKAADIPVNGSSAGKNEETAAKEAAAEAAGFIEKIKTALKTTKGKWIAFGAGSAVIIGAAILLKKSPQVSDDKNVSR